MEVDFNVLLKQLTSPRLLSPEEQREVMTRAVLRVLRHGDSAARIFHDRFGLYRSNDFVALIRSQFSRMPQEAFAEQFDSVVQLLMESERIEFRSGKIRALYGHSIQGIIVGQMKWPEVPLFHATSQRHLPLILEFGLRPQGRSWVHLTSQLEYANRIQKHHSYDGHGTLLRIAPERLEDHSVTFRQPNSHIWLANRITPEAIQVFEPHDYSESFI